MSADNNKFGFVIRDAVGVGVFTVFATIFFSIDFKYHAIYGLWCSFLSLAALFHAPAHYFSKANPRKRAVVWIVYWCLLIAIACWFSVWSYTISHPVPENHPSSQIVESKIPKWLPPELPEGCSNIYILCGHVPEKYPTSMLGLVWDTKSNPPKLVPKSKTELIIEMEFPEPQTASTNPISWENMLITFPSNNTEFVRYFINYPIHPFIATNRLYVMVKIPSQTNMIPITMTDAMDSEIPANWDRNYSSNAFEIVDEFGLPVLQVYYKRPNEIEVDGVFFINSRCSIGAFAKSFENGMSGLVLHVNGGGVSLKDVLAEFPKRKALFKYPAYQHPGEYAD